MSRVGVRMTDDRANRHLADSLRRCEPDQVQRDSLSRAPQVAPAPRSMEKC